MAKKIQHQQVAEQCDRCLHFKAVTRFKNPGDYHRGHCAYTANILWINTYHCSRFEQQNPLSLISQQSNAATSDK